MASATCPSRADLAALITGRLPEDSLKALGEHLDGCPACLATVQQLRTEPDPLLDAFHDSPSEDAFAAEAACQEAVARWQQVPPTTREVFVPSTAVPAYLTNYAHEGAVETPAPRQVAGYELVSELGRGGMGIVYQARDRKLNRSVGLKMVRAGMSASSVELVRFLSEAESAARLHHPNIVQIYEFGRHHDDPFFAMELLEGGSLAKKIAGIPQAPRFAAELVETLAQAVHYAHQQGIIHRDLKPSNILLTAEGVPRITDFGLAKRVEGDSGLTASGTILGTPSYMAPEQARGEQRAIGPGVDVYALGAILYELLTGRPPFRAATPLDTIYQVLNQDPVAPCRLQPSLPRDLETICLKCLEKEPHKRYADAEALADDLHRFLDGEPIRARPIGLWERGLKWARRRPTAAALVGVSSFAAITLIVVGIVYNAWLQTALSKAEENLERAKQAEQVATEQKQEAIDRLWESYLAQAQAGRWSGRAGRRFDSLKALADAAKIRYSLELRNEAIACMALVDIRGTKEWELVPPDNHTVAFDRTLAHYAHPDSKGNISIRRVEDHKEIMFLLGPGVGVGVLRFSPDGQFLAAKYHPDGRDYPNQLCIWDLQSRKAAWKLPKGIHDAAVAISPDSRWLAAGLTDRSICLYDLSSGKKLKELARSMNPYALAFCPNSRQLAVSSRFTDLVEVFDVETSKAVQKLKHPCPVRGIAWRPDGKLLAAAGADGRIYVSHTDSAKRQAVLEGHQGVAVHVAFNHAGDILVSTSWDTKSRFWDPLTGKPLLSTSGAYMQFSPDDQKLAFYKGPSAGLAEVACPREYRTFQPSAGAAKAYWSVDLSPDRRLLASATPDGVSLWDVTTASQVAFLPAAGGWSALFHPDGKTLITSGRFGLHRWPIQREPESPDVVQIGPRQPLGLAEGTAAGHACLSLDKRTLVVAAGQALVLDLQEPKRMLRLAPDGVGAVAVSPDGQWVAAVSGQGAHIWDGRTGSVVKQPPLKSNSRSDLAFSPDGKWLVTSSLEEYSFWQVGSWQPAHRIARPSGGELPGRLAFARDGRILAIAYSSFVVKLVDPATGREIATLETPESAIVSSLSFSADGSKLAAASESKVIQVWDLARIRAQLADIGLADGFPSLPPPYDPVGVTPLKVKILHTLAQVLEAEQLPILESQKCKPSAQDMNEWGAAKWSKGRHLFCAAERGGWVELALRPPQPGRYRLDIHFTKAPDYGIVEVSLDGKKLGQRFDSFNEEVVPSGKVSFGIVNLSAKDHRLRFTVVNKNPRSQDYHLGIDCVRLEAVAETAP